MTLYDVDYGLWLEDQIAKLKSKRWRDTIPVKVRQAFVEAVTLLKHYYELGSAV